VADLHEIRPSYTRRVADLHEIRRAFAQPTEFTTSPLYRALSRTVAGDDALLRLAARRTPGQYPTFLFFGAVHHLLLGGVEHELATYFPSIVGDEARPAEDAGPALVSFCTRYGDELGQLISTRLVQTNHVQRSLALRLGLSVVAREVATPVHLVEIGASAGLNLRVDRYGYQVGGRRFGDPGSPVQIMAQWYGVAPVPDLDRLPPLASTTGVDLHPVNTTDLDTRRWLESLIWPENRHQRALLAAALTVVAADPPPILAGDAVDVCPALARTLPPGQPRVVFHSATRMHVRPDRLGAFDAAIAAFGVDGPLYCLSLEDKPDHDPRPAPARHGTALTLRRPDGTTSILAVVDGHLHWIEPLDL
jgi:hypothetical protein